MLNEASAMPVLVVQDGQPLAPDHVYVAPSQAQCRVEDRKLRLGEIRSSGDETAIDLLFRSAADARRHRAIGVVLWGAGCDGAAGLREISLAGGIPLAQTPHTAVREEMPRAALSGGGCECALTIDELASRLDFIAGHLYLQIRSSADDLPVNERQMAQSLGLLHSLARIDGSQYLPAAVKRRLLRRMAVTGNSEVDAYLERLKATPAEAHRLGQELLAPRERFRFDGRSLEAAAERALAGLLDDRPRGEPFRVWAPGFSSGEPAYAAAIALAAAWEAHARPAEIKVFGADRSEQAIKQARAASYPAIIADEISGGRMMRYFRRIDGAFRLKREIREMCVFARQDVLQDPPFSRLDLIVCGSSFGSLNEAAQQTLRDRFHYALRPGGFLLLDEEMAAPEGERFVQVDERWPLYRKTTDEISSDAPFAAPPLSGTIRETTSSRESHVQREANRVLLDRYAPPGVIVDDDFRILQFQGRVGRYLAPASGEASLNLLRMLGDGLLYDLRGAFNDARMQGVAVRREGLRVELDGEGPLVNIEVVPLEPTSEQRHYLVLFEASSLTEGAKQRPHSPQAAAATRSEARLQREMALNQEYLQSVIRDLQQSNEELQSAVEETLSSNEELQSTNEELDAAKEELQSTNEELNTVNDELHSRNLELGQVNQDLMGLLSNLHIAVVMISSDLRIRRFTPLAEKLLNLIPGDVGRPVSHIRPAVDCPDLDRLIEDAVRRRSVERRDVSDSLGKHYVLTIRPYSDADGRLAGALLTLFDKESLQNAS